MTGDLEFSGGRGTQRGEGCATLGEGSGGGFSDVKARKME